MCTIGIFRDSRGLKNTVFEPAAIRSFNNEVSFMLQNGAGDACGFANSDYEMVGALVVESQNEIMNYADIIIVHDEINLSVELRNYKIFLTDINYFNNFASLKTMIGEPVSLFSFSDENMKSCPLSKHRDFNSYYLGFLKYYLGEPVSSDFINVVSLAKVLERGRIVNKGILDQIEMI